MLATLLLLGFLAVASATDIAGHKIYNWTTYPGILAALGLSVGGWLLLATTAIGQERLAGLGWQPVTQSVWGLLVCGGLMLVCYVFFQVGGADVKLMAMMGAFLGPEEGLIAMLWTFVLGACMGLTVLVWRVGPLRLIGRAWRQAACSLKLGWWSPLTEDERAQLQARLFLAPCALAAVVIVRLGLMDFLSS
jgi:prepilin peptidase CpaA